MNSFKVVLAALLLGAFSLTVTGCPGKKEEAPVERMEDAADDTMDSAEEAGEEVTDEVDDAM